MMNMAKRLEDLEAVQQSKQLYVWLDMSNGETVEEAKAIYEAAHGADETRTYIHWQTAITRSADAGATHEGRETSRGD